MASKQNLKVPQHLSVKADPRRYAAKLRFNRESDKRRGYKRVRDVFKQRARKYIANRIQRGKLTRGDCVVCGDKNAHAHHNDYSFPNLIAWLCHTHHADVHAGRLALTVSQIVDVPA